MLTRIFRLALAALLVAGPAFAGGYTPPAGSGSGTVTAVTCGFGLTGGTINTSGTCAVNPAALAQNGLKNRLRNPSQIVDQRNGGAAVTLGTAPAYDTDGWFGWTGSSPAGETAQRVSVLSGGVAYAARLQRASGGTATAAINHGEVLETVPNIDLQGQSVTYSFKARAGANFSGNSLSYRIATGTGTDQGAGAFALGSASGGWTGYAAATAATCTPTTSWSVCAATFTVPASATQIGVSVSWTPSGTAGSADYVDVTDEQLELGTFTAAQVVYERRPIQTDFEVCARMYQVLALTARGYAGTSSSIIETPIPFQVTMRATPAAGLVSAGTRAGLSSVSVGSLGPLGGRFIITAQQTGDVYAVADGWAFNAELN